MSQFAAGLLYPSGDIDEAVRLTRDLVAHPEKRQQMGAAARKEVSRDLSVCAAPHPVVSEQHCHPGKVLGTLLLHQCGNWMLIAAVWVKFGIGTGFRWIAGGAVGLVGGHGAPAQPAVLAGNRVLPRQAPVSALVLPPTPLLHTGVRTFCSCCAQAAVVLYLCLWWHLMQGGEAVGNAETSDVRV